MDVNRWMALRDGKVSPDTILSWSDGEITLPETLHAESGQPVRGGLFDEEIFGPRGEWDTEESASRMGHICTVWPILPKCLLEREDNRLSCYLEMDSDDLYRLCHYQTRVLLVPEENGDPELTYGKLFTNPEYLEYLGEHETGPGECASGPEAIVKLIRNKKMLKVPKGSVDPEWSLLKYIPVIPPCERSLVPEAEHTGEEDLNEIYRNILEHDQRVRQFQKAGAKPYAWVRDALELQNACDRLFALLEHKYCRIS